MKEQVTAYLRTDNPHEQRRLIKRLCFDADLEIADEYIDESDSIQRLIDIQNLIRENHWNGSALVTTDLHMLGSSFPHVYGLYQLFDLSSLSIWSRVGGQFMKLNLDPMRPVDVRWSGVVSACHDWLEILFYEEESSNTGRPFRTTNVSSCRSLHCADLIDITERMNSLTGLNLKYSDKEPTDNNSDKNSQQRNDVA